jgi:hypothetical protein
MKMNPTDILKILDEAAEVYNFPMLDNIYVKLAASRMSLYRSERDWGMVIEIFGSTPKSRLPDTHIYTYASSLINRDKPEHYVSQEAYQTYLATNPHNESRFIYPIEEGAWLELESQTVTTEARQLHLRNQLVKLPNREQYTVNGIPLTGESPTVFELCRFLAAQYRNLVLATKEERCISLPANMTMILHLEEWYHPDLADDQLPSDTQTFQQLAQVLATGDPSLYKPTEKPNTHWRNWQI